MSVSVQDKNPPLVTRDDLRGKKNQTKTHTHLLWHLALATRYRWNWEWLRARYLDLIHEVIKASVRGLWPQFLHLLILKSVPLALLQQEQWHIWF